MAKSLQRMTTIPYIYSGCKIFIGQITYRPNNEIILSADNEIISQIAFIGLTRTAPTHSDTVTGRMNL